MPITAQILGQAYDALGHAGRKIDGASDLTLAYDAAERLTEVRDSVGGQLPWKSFVYATANGVNDWRQGKLQKATRYNRYDVLLQPQPGPDEIFSSGFECGDLSGWNGTPLSCTLGTEVHYDIAVEESYTYGGKAGGVSRRDTEILFNGSGGTTFTQGFAYTDLGDVASLDYPRCDFTQCTSDGDAGAQRSVGFTYTRGLLTAVSGYAPTIEYHPSGLLHRVYHTNAPRLVQEPDANGMARPARILAKLDSTTLWSTGFYSFDGAGNVKSIGGSSFVYDRVSRLTSAKVSLGQQGTGSLVEQGYSYDAFGNLLAITGNPGRTIPTDSSTNRLSGSVSYDAAGNLLAWNGNLYEYDPLHMMTGLTTPGGEDWLYVYTADDERIWMYDLAGASRYTLRNLSGQVLREYTVANDYWTRERDYIYGNGKLLAAETPQGLRHFYPDHLGTPRLITDASGNQVAYHVYFPYGEEATDPFQDQEAMKFTGHERDFNDLAGTGDDLDYMHARFCSPLTGRFLSVDPKVTLKRAMKRPQAWNRYSYAGGNPLKYIDPTGQIFKLSSCAEGGNTTQCTADTQLLRDALGDSGDQIRVNPDGTVSLAKGVSGSQFAASGDFQKGLLMLIGDQNGVFSLVTGSGEGAKTGGGKFEPDQSGGGTIYLEPGMFPRQTGDVMGTAAIALVHETGHALGQLFPRHFQKLNATLSGKDFVLRLKGEGYVVNFENRYRLSIEVDIRTSYSQNLLDPILDFDVDLFPRE